MTDPNDRKAAEGSGTCNERMRYLNAYYIRTALQRGKTIGQFLGGGATGEHRTIRWLDIRPDGERFCLAYYEAIDEGSDSFLDLYEFPYASPDDDPPEHFFNTIEEVLRYSGSAYGASDSRWVNQFVVQDEYADYLKKQSRLKP